MSRTRLPREAQELFAQAQKNAEGTPPRKHHLVPASYLERWAEDGKIRVTVVDEQNSYLSTPRNAARETDYYRLEHPDLDPDDVPPLLIETGLSRLEATAKTIIDELLAHRDPTRLHPQAIAHLTWHLAFSVTRGKTFRDRAQERIGELYRLKYEKMTDAGIVAMLRKRGLDPTPENIATHRDMIDKIVAGTIVPVIPQPRVIADSAKLAEPIGEKLLERTWVVYDTPPILVTCDEPVVVVGGPGWPRTQQAGVETAGVVMYPLAPNALLAMFHPDVRVDSRTSLDHIEVAEVNREIIAASTRWAFERPSRRVTQALRVPKAPLRATAREVLPTESDDREIHRAFTLSRWTTDAPPWPVARWWQSGWTAKAFVRLSELPPGAKVTIASDREIRGPRVRKKRRRR